MTAYKKLIHTIFIPLFIVGILLVPAGRAYAAVILQVGDPTDAGSMDQLYSPSRAATPTDGLEHLLATATLFMAKAETNDWHVQLRHIDGGLGNPWKDCFSQEIFDSELPTFNGSNPSVGATIELSFSGTECTMEEGLEYHIYLMPSSVTEVGNYGLAVWNGETANGGPSIIITDTPPTPPVTATRIISVTPPNDPNQLNARATSTTFAVEGTGYVSVNDFISGMVFRLNIKNNAGVPTQNLVGPGYSSAGVAICNWLFDWLCPPVVDDDTQITGAQTSVINRTWEFPIESDEDFDYATTTNLQQIGRYTLTASILVPQPDFAGIAVGSYTLISTTTTFFVATSTYYDVAHDAAVALTNQLSSSAAAANCEVDFTSLFGLLDMGDCIIYLFSGSTEYVADALRIQIADLTSRAPWGYATRVYIILTGETASSTLPSIAAHVPSGLPFEGKEFDFTPWTGIENTVATLQTKVPEDQTESAYDLFVFWWNTMWLIVFALWLLQELYGTLSIDMEHNPESTFRGGGKKYKVVGQSPVKLNIRRKRGRL